MHDRREKCHESYEIARTGANLNTGLRERVRLVPANAGVEAVEAAAIVVIEKRLLIRECLTRCLRVVSGHAVVSFPNIDSWIEAHDDIPASVIMLCSAGKPNAPDMHREISRLSRQDNPLPIILLSDEEDPDQIADAIGHGVRGYIPTSTSLDVVVEVLRLVRAGVIFVPAGSLIAAGQSNGRIAASHRICDGLFTARQAAVVEALRRGKANKVIASELNMRESTVKVHVRNIMKKLKARNRTEVAVMTNELMRDGGVA
jgi:DNA-binding NarL/FixJ family response regulator